MKIKRMTSSPAETKKIGKTLGKFLRAGDVLALAGELGAGKTTLVQGIAKGLGVMDEKSVSSPTFVLTHEYQGREKIYHLDWYRLSRVRGADAEMAEEYFSSGAVTLVEWPEKGKSLLPPQTVFVEILHRGNNRRALLFSFPAKTGAGIVKALKKI